MAILTPYAGLLAFVYLVLTFRTIMFRGRLRVGIGDGGDKSLQRAIRAHANFSEYVPITLILLLLLTSVGAGPGLLHGLGGALVIGRILHGYGVSQVQEKLIFRQIGMVLTTGVIAVAGGYLLWVFARVGLAG
ncbi:glutathione metabolism protein [Ahniella affigens]|uniref:Glutathione metabolism protein n=1 Tax=Ahniella affigens TaxID=2021234 RepID=A0A2P1PWK3_9GAMM|nr:MAPEG family protein [Ahniella affigens]AVP99216.1 glutathione metabolism protein [Ahniella affigens]